MHIRTMTKCCPAKAADIAYVLDTISQTLSIVEDIPDFLATIRDLLGKQ